MHSVKSFDVIKMYEHKFYKAFQMILVELEGEEMIIKHHNLGNKDSIDKEVLEYRQSIQNKVKKIQQNKILEYENAAKV